MHHHTAIVRWTRADAAFAGGRYSRAHEWSFDGGVTVRASASPHVVREPYSDPHAVDPEEAFVASVASCHMLTFLDLASRAGYVVESYEDVATGSMAKNAAGKSWVDAIVLAPQIRFVGARQPTAGELALLHDRAHHECFIANSVRTAVSVSL